MMLRRIIELGLSFMALTIVASVILPGDDVLAYTPDANGARAYANDFCPDVVYPEDKIADYMWATGLDGRPNLEIISGGSEQVDITINFYATYCARWPGGWTNGARDLEIRDNGVDRLVSGPGAVTYGPKTSGYGTRSSPGLQQYDGKLNVAGWGTGWHTVCTWFSTTTTRPGVLFFQSPSACFDLYLNRIDKWGIISDSKVGVDFTPPNVPTWTANPGQTLYWKHSIGNVGPGKTNQPIGYAIGKAGFSAGAWTNGAAPNNNDPQGTTNILNSGEWFDVGWGTTRSSYSQYRVRQADVGNNLCQSISFGPTAWDNPAWTASTPACVYVPYNYNLIPSVTGPNGMGSVGSTIPPVTPRIDNQLTGNAGLTTKSPDNVEWQLKRVEVDPGRTIPMNQQQNNTIPCTHYRSGGATRCIDKGNGTQSFPAGSTTLALLNNEKINPGTPVGTKICFTLSVRPYSQTSSNWRHSAPVCITVSRQPKLQVWGSDVRSRGKIETGTTIITSGGSDKLFGSWVEYGGFSTGANSGFASGSGLNNGNVNTAADAWNKLTFANVDTRGNDNYGGFTLPPLPNLSAQFMGPATGTMRADIGSLGSGTYRMNNFTITGGAIDNGKTIIIIATGTVTINGNITYKGNGSSGTFNSVGDLPQVIIIANTINITNTTEQINAWLLTTGSSGSINTCWAANRAVTAALNSTVCDKQLTVNGPVVTEHLHLRRTAGSENAAEAGKPAEVFNLRPDAYLWAQARASQSGKVQTVYSVELPPRF
jgi:hypothetical protein